MNLQRSLVRLGILLFASTSTGWAVDHMVTANPNLTFTPSSLTIDAGDTVTFTNAGGFHNAVVDNGSGTLRCASGCDGDGNGGNGSPSGANWSATVAFNTAGTFGYHCEIHVSDGMVGNIKVNAVTPSPPSVTLGGYLSGNWFDPSTNQGGHGFQLEFTDQANTIVAIWFVYPPIGGGQNWIYAQGTFDSTKNTVTIPAVLLSGPKFPPLYNSNYLQQTNWGTLTFTFGDCNTGTATWASTVTGYGSGSIPIQRLTSIQGTSCPQTSGGGGY